MAEKKMSPPLVYVDSCVYIDLIQRNGAAHADTGEERWRSAKALFDAVHEGHVRLAASSLVEAEVCCHWDARSEKERVRTLLATWFSAGSTQWIEVDRYLARQAVRLTKEWSHVGEKRNRFGAADAVHMAAAVELGADYLMTHDGGFPIGHQVETTRLLRPQVVWQESLLGAV